ncbi:MAG TPA: phage terminase large subunit [Ktedonobacterales bacterium]
MATALAPLPVTHVRYVMRGAAARLFFGDAARAPTVLLAGPAGTGKTRAALETTHARAVKYPGSRHLLCRKTFSSLKASGMVTFDERVLDLRHWLIPMGEGFVGRIEFHGETASRPAGYHYPNGSVIVVGGMDKPSKTLSMEFDTIYFQEATEATEDEVETLTRSFRAGNMPYHQLLMDANPNAPTHWLKQRANADKLLMLESHHEDNPLYWDGHEWTRDGERYIAILDALTGVRKLRLRDGIWAAAEGMVYQDAWEPERNHVARSRYSRRPESLEGDCGIDRNWSRYMAIDWGYRAPMAVQWYAKMPDGELLLYREIYVTNQAVELVAKEALAYMGYQLTEMGQLVPTRSDADPLPREIVADVDPGERATWEMHFGLSVFPAKKGQGSVSDGIQAVTRRLQDGRLIVLQGSLVQRDADLDEKKQPCCFAEEMESYVWDTRAGRPAKEQPIDDHDHAMDACRYLVQYFDRGVPDAGTISLDAVGW